QARRSGPQHSTAAGAFSSSLKAVAATALTATDCRSPTATSLPTPPLAQRYKGALLRTAACGSIFRPPNNTPRAKAACRPTSEQAPGTDRDQAVPAPELGWPSEAVSTGIAIR